MTKIESGAPNAQEMKTCATCNASHKNSIERVLRCMGCVAKPNGNSKWRPETLNEETTTGRLRGLPSVGSVLLDRFRGQDGRFCACGPHVCGLR